ncbi:MAG: TRAP transporter large permease subunit [Alphaproteobacteria bacterium]|nr:TRAP transporter large permease subunit [Alphaproteobacteria bacterium]
MEFLIDILPGLMFGTLVITLFSGLPVAIMLMGVTLIFGVIALAMGEMRFVQMTLLPTRIYGGIIQNPVLVAAPMFIFMGLILEKTRIAEDLLNSLQRVMRVVPGGLALAVILMGTILAAATGIIGASVVMLTVIAIPTMLDKGYSPTLAAGTVASAGTLGILIPPSVMLVFMGDLLGINLAKLFIAAFMPGMILAGAYLVYIVIISAINPKVAPKLPPLAPEEREGLLLETFIALILPLLLITAVLGSILGGIATPTEASGVGVAAALLLGFVRGRISWTSINEAMDGSVKTLAMLFFIFVGATGFSYVFRGIGGEDFIINAAHGLNLGDWGLLAMMMLMIFLMGFFFDWIEIILIIMPIFAPLVMGLDLGDHVSSKDMIYWFAVLVAVNLQTSFLTPPFGFALFYLKGAAGNRLKMSEIYKGIIPFVLVQIAVLGALVAWPEIILSLPRMLLK